MQEAFSSPLTLPRLRAQLPLRQCFCFGAASASLQLPVDDNYDIALTPNGRSLLLASALQGLIEVRCTSARELSRWQPPSRGVLDEFVLSVAALNDGRAAVSLFFAKCVVLLRRNEAGGDSSRSSSNTGGEAHAAAAGRDNAWVEEHRVDHLSLPALQLSAHGDVLAACIGTNRVLLLQNLSSGPQRNAERQRQYAISRLAVAAQVVVTKSRGKVVRPGIRQAAYLLDAHSLDNRDKRLWRYVLRSSAGDGKEADEKLYGICADSISGCLYAAVCRSDNFSGRVSVLSLEDGSELRHVALSFQPAAAAAPQRSLCCCFPWGGAAARVPPLLPIQLSLCDDGATAADEQELNSSSDAGGRVMLLAALCWNPTTKGMTTLTLHRSTRYVLQ